MIRVIQRKIILPRGNTGSFTIPTLTSVKEGDKAVFSLIDPLTHSVVFEKIIPATEGTITVPFVREDTINLVPKKYNWDMTIYVGPQYDEDGTLVGAEEIHSYYAGFSLPIFDLREVTEDVPRTQAHP